MNLINLRRRSLLPLIALGVMAAVVVFVMNLTANAAVTESVRTDTPIVLNGVVWDIEQVGNTVVVAGSFTQVQTSRNGPIVTQPGIFAYDLDSGMFIDTFRPILANRAGSTKAVEVRDLVAAEDGKSVYLGGRFVTIDDRSDGKVRTRNRLAKLNVSDGRLDRNFAQAGVDSKVMSLALADGYLYVGGIFQRVYDTAIGRPPVFRDVRGLARFDATTGSYDPGFRVETRVDAGSNWQGGRGYGVSSVDVTPDGTKLVIAHRGKELFDANRNESFARPGIAIIDLTTAGGPSVTAFRGLFPVAADPNQDFFWEGQCSGRGIQIKDMEVSPDGTYFVTVSQGADSGYQCDTAVRWPITTAGGVRPDWVARVFDSVFSVGIANDAVYIGGHFRYMTTSNSPSPYPGRTVVNGARVGDIYTANGTSTNFRNDLVNPGYVFPANQIGAINPTTGLGIETWRPRSNAFACVCALTVIDRGLLIGQDRDRINGFYTGRHGFLDNTPDAGDPQCRVSLDDLGRPVVQWTAIGNVNQWNIAGNGAFVGSSTTTSFLHTEAMGGQRFTYELRFNRNGISQTDNCGTVFVEANGTINLARSGIATQSSTLGGAVATRAIDGNTDGIYANGSVSHTNGTSQQWWQVELTRQSSIDGIAIWNRTDSNTDQLADVSVFISNAPIADGTIDQIRARAGITEIRRNGVQGRLISITDDLRGRYIRIQMPANALQLAEVEVLGQRSAVLDCSVTQFNGVPTITWNDTEAGRYTVRRDGIWKASVDGTTWTDTALVPGTYTYTVEAIEGGATTQTATCGLTIALTTLTCNATAVGNTVTVTWNDGDWTRASIWRDDAFVATVDGADLSWSETITAGTYKYTVKASVNGQDAETGCGTVTIDLPTLTCTAGVVDSTATVNWSDGGWSRVSVSRDSNFQAMVDNGALTWSETLLPGTYAYTIKAVINGLDVDANCGTATIEPAPLTCSAATAGDTVTVAWTDGGWNRVSIRRNGAFQALIEDGSLTWNDTPGAGTHAYTIEASINGQNIDANCGTVTIAAKVLTCTATIADGNVNVTWNSVDADSYQVRRNGSWAATVDAATTSWTDTGAAAAANTYAVRYRTDGANVTINCG